MNSGANFLQSLGWAVLNSLWQLALIWVLYQVITGIYRKMSASSKSSLATLLLVAGFGWFLFTFISVFGKASTSQVIAASPLVNAEANPELNNWLQNTLPIASVLYLVLLIFPTLHFIRNYRYVQVIRKYGRTKIDANWRLFVQEIASRMGIRQEVRIWVSELVSSPVTIGFLKPVILVPLAAINHLTPQQLEAVLLHELSHIRRYDYLVNLVLHFIHTILYFNPFAKAFVKIVEKEREKSCDELVLQFQYDSHDYASALLTLEKEGQASKAFTMGADGKRHDLLSRIELILGVQKKPMFSFNKLAGLMAGLLLVIALNAILIISRPANAHRASDFASLRNAGELFKNSGQAAPEKETPGTEVAVAEKPETVINHLHFDGSGEQPVNPKEPVTDVSPKGFMAYAFQNEDIMPVAYMEKMMPLLTASQEQQVKSALDASKKVIVNTQWKALEKEIGEVFTQKEKEQLRTIYAKQYEKINWKELEEKLAYAYNTVNWEQVNHQLNEAIDEIRLDSLQDVYNQAICKISDVQKELELNKMQGIPDSGIDQNVLELKKNELKRELNRVKAVRTKKIVHL